MKSIQVPSNWPADFQPEENEILIQATSHAGEPRTHEYPGTDPWIEILCVVDMVTGTSCDAYELPPRLYEELRERVIQYLAERATA